MDIFIKDSDGNKFVVTNGMYPGDEDGTQIYRIDTENKKYWQVWHTGKFMQTAKDGNNIFNDYQQALHKWDNLRNNNQSIT